ncbi:MAG: SH3 domain-containing protein [Treponema sp.]|nr:SH3 domain-containing protein [Treponema sp.]
MKTRPVVLFPIILALLACLFSSCTRLLGFGVLLWSTEEPPIPSGTVLPVYIHSNIDQVWVVGIPEDYRSGKGGLGKMEIPLPKLELARSKRAAEERAAAFAEYARTYAENLQDGLPIRENADNSARRVYRLRGGEIVKILEKAEGNVAVGADGNPLPGSWYKVMTEGGNTGYCFSYRLRLFEHEGGALAAVETEKHEAEDPELEKVLTKIWSPEVYGDMVNRSRIDLEAFSNHWGFSPGQDTGTARINIHNLDRSFTYTGIRSTGNHSWRFEGTDLRMTLRSDRVLAVQYTEEGGGMRSLVFVNLPVETDDLIVQETGRREHLFYTIYTQGPRFTSNNYGTLSFAEDGRFNWKGYELLVPQVIPAAALGSGFISMDLFLAPSLTERYEGAFSLNFDSINGDVITARFMYSLENQGFRLEFVPGDSMEGRLVTRRTASPLIIYFFTGD